MVYSSVQVCNVCMHEQVYVCRIFKCTCMQSWLRSRLSASLRPGLAWPARKGSQSHDGLMGTNMKEFTKQAAYVCIHVSLYAQHTMSARVKHSGERCRQLALCLVVTRCSAAKSTQRLCMESWVCEQQAAHVVYSCVHL